MTKRPSGTRPPYAVLSRHYDEAYASWRVFLSIARDELFRKHRVRFASVLDVGAGSGWQALELARRGARVVAVEPVASFLPPLRRAAKAAGLAVDVRQGALPELPLEPGERFDLALATFDVLNHLPSRPLLGAALGSLAGALRRGGHLLFDVVTPETIGLFPEHHRVTRLASGILSAETAALDPDSGDGILTRDWFLPVKGAHGSDRGDGGDTRDEETLYRHVRESYREIAWQREEVEEALDQAGFAVRLFEDASGWISLSPPGARWLVLARRR